MISVHIHSNNSFKLKGDCLRYEGQSSIAIQPDGWTVRLSIDRFGVQEAIGLRRSEIIPTIRHMLDNCNQDEDVHESEIALYLSYLQQFAEKRAHDFHLATNMV